MAGSRPSYPYPSSLQQSLGFSSDYDSSTTPTPQLPHQQVRPSSLATAALYQPHPSTTHSHQGNAMLANPASAVHWGGYPSQVATQEQYSVHGDHRFVRSSEPLNQASLYSSGRSSSTNGNLAGVAAATPAAPPLPQRHSIAAEGQWLPNGFTGAMYSEQTQALQSNPPPPSFLQRSRSLAEPTASSSHLLADNKRKRSRSRSRDRDAAVAGGSGLKRAGSKRNSLAKASGQSMAAGGSKGGLDKDSGMTTIFQCRGFGDCNMTFTRSEHLARHIR